MESDFDDGVDLVDKMMKEQSSCNSWIFLSTVGGDTGFLDEKKVDALESIVVNIDLLAYLLVVVQDVE